MKKITKKDNLLKIAETIFRDLEKLLSVDPSERKGLTEIQIQTMRSQIQQRINLMKSGCLPPTSQRHNYLTREVVDSWPFGLAIVERICEFESSYNALE